MLWHHAAEVAQRGDLGSLPDLAIAQAVAWSKKPHLLIDGLVAAGFLDRDETHRLVIHDWPEHCEQSVCKYLEYGRKDFLPVYRYSLENRKRKDRKSLPSRVAEAEASEKETTEKEKPSKSKKLSRSEASPEFEEFWAGYWLKKAKADAWRAYAAHVTTPALHVAVMEAVEAQTPEMMSRDASKRPYGATWLNAGRWNDEIVAPSNGAKSNKQDILLKGIGL